MQIAGMRVGTYRDWPSHWGNGSGST